MGKAARYCRGKGGSMHIADQETGTLGMYAMDACNAILNLPKAAILAMRRTVS